jgi:hypothetical protein
MAINAAKTNFIVFNTRGKRVDPEDCSVDLCSITKKTENKKNKNGKYLT